MLCIQVFKELMQQSFCFCNYYINTPFCENINKIKILTAPLKRSVTHNEIVVRDLRVCEHFSEHQGLCDCSVLTSETYIKQNVDFTCNFSFILFLPFEQYFNQHMIVKYHLNLFFLKFCSLLL